jgi:hypothetical protein
MIAIMATIARLGFVLSNPHKIKQKKTFLKIKKNGIYSGTLSKIANGFEFRCRNERTGAEARPRWVFGRPNVRGKPHGL